MLAAHLAAYGAGEDGTIFTTRTATPLGHVCYGYNVLRRAATKAGLPEETTSHDLRHHYARVLLAAGEWPWQSPSGWDMRRLIGPEHLRLPDAGLRRPDAECHRLSLGNGPCLLCPRAHGAAHSSR
jgi:integrase